MSHRDKFTAPLEQDPLTPSEERARIYAVKGYLRARDGQYDQAQQHFAQAAGLDPELDLTTVPRFWDLPRAAHDCAVAALEQVGRNREASRLLAIINRRFRPKLVNQRPRPIEPIT
jgi:tetratricopeptide (TPR) repeat protein